MRAYANNTMMSPNCHECSFERYYSDIEQTVCMAKLIWIVAGIETIQFEGRAWCPLAEIPEDQIEYVLRNMKATLKNFVSECEWAFGKKHE